MTHTLDVAHIGHVELFTPQMAASRDFFASVLGLEEVGRDGASLYLRGYGDYQLYGLKLTESERAGLGHLAFRTRSEEGLHARVKALEDAGLVGEWSDGDLGHGPAYRFVSPGGHRIELYFETERYHAPASAAPPAKNQYARRGGAGVGVKRLDHLNLFAADVAPARAFAEQLLGFRTLDQVLDDDGIEVGAFMTLSIAPLELVFTVDRSALPGRLHHLAFWVDTREEVLRAADIFVDHGVTIEVAPAKHTVGQSFFLYAFEPGGNRIEVMTAADFQYDPDAPVRVWTAAERRAGIGWGTRFPETWSTYGTP